jgi:hypothetical protein
MTDGPVPQDAALHADPAARGRRLRELWVETLGPDADPETGFLDNGGDSFTAVLLVNRIAEETGWEADYLDVLEATGVADLDRLLTPASDPEPDGARGHG